MIPTDTTARPGTRVTVIDADSGGTGTVIYRGSEPCREYDDYYDDITLMDEEINEERKAEIEFQKSLIKNEKPSPVFFPRPELKRRMMACNRLKRTGET